MMMQSHYRYSPANVVLALLVVVVIILLIVYYTMDGSSSTDPEKMEAAAKVATANEPPPPDGAVLMRKVRDKTPLLPASMYAGLNYGTPVVERIAATQAMIDVFDGLLDNTKQAPTMGEDAVFYLRDPPTKETMRQFNSFTLDAVVPGVRHQVVTVSQSTPWETQGKYAVYAFLDKGVDWSRGMVDYSKTDDEHGTILSDVWRSA